MLLSSFLAAFAISIKLPNTYGILIALAILKTSLRCIFEALGISLSVAIFFLSLKLFRFDIVENERESLINNSDKIIYFFILYIYTIIFIYIIDVYLYILLMSYDIF